jgi:NADH-quinone oxidoreductase subunit C
VDASAIIDTLMPLVPGATYEAVGSVDVATIYVPKEHLVATCAALAETPSLGFAVIIEITAADYLHHVPARRSRYEVVYHLLSVSNRQRVRLKVRVDPDETVPTVQQVWPGAGWPEREVWDMFGIIFAGHPDLRRLLMPEDWDGHPARKDYPVQIRKAAQTYEPLEVSEAEFRANIERDRVKRTH